MMRSKKGWKWMKRSNWKLKRCDRNWKSVKDRESWQGGRQAYHLRVGCHKLRRKKKKKKTTTRSKIKREEAERRRGEGERRENNQDKGKNEFHDVSTEKTGPKASKTVDVIQINNTERYAIVDMNGALCCWPIGGPGTLLPIIVNNTWTQIY